MSVLSKILGGLGMGLSFVPGPWSAIGTALTAAGGIAGTVAESRDAKKQERQEQVVQPPEQQGARPTERAGFKQQEEQQAQNGQGPQKTFQPRSPGPNLGDYRLQMNQEIADMLINGSFLNDTRGPYG